MPAPTEPTRVCRVAGACRRYGAGAALAWLIWAVPVHAQDENAPPAVQEVRPEGAVKGIGPFAACHQKVPGGEIMLDEASRRVQETVCGAALWFDGLFGEKGDVVAARRSYGRLEVATDYSDFYGSKTRVRFHARVLLPQLQERLSAFVGLDDEDDFVRDRSEGPALRSRNLRPTDQDSFLAGLGFTAVTTDRFQSDFRVGVRNVTLPKVFAQNRLSYIPYSTAASRIYLRTTPFWNNRDGVGLTQGIDLDRVVAQDFLLRWASIGTFSEESAGLDWRTALVLYQNLPGKKALAYEAFIRGAAAAAEPLGEYGVRAVYRAPLLRERLFGELVLGYSWPRTDPALPREGSTLVGLSLELPFGKAPN